MLSLTYCYAQAAIGQLTGRSPERNLSARFATQAFVSTKSVSSLFFLFFACTATSDSTSNPFDPVLLVDYWLNQEASVSPKPLAKDDSNVKDLKRLASRYSS